MKGTIEIGSVMYSHIDGRLLKRRGKGFIKSFPDEWGYLKYHLGQNRKTINIFVHTVVWMWCKGPVPEGMTIDHIDNDRGNNVITNLQLLTRGDNAVKGNARWWNVVSPTGVVELVYNVEAYCRVHNLHPGHLRNTAKSGKLHKGYTCHESH